jgi:glycogen(starch) synthase
MMEARMSAHRPLRILISTHDFYPSLGGIETAGMTLARGLTRRGYDVTVVTATAGGPDDFPFRIVRQPGTMELIRLVRDADLLWQNHVTLRLVWPVLFVRRPTVFAHHIWLNVGGVEDLRFGFLKHLVCRTGQNVYVSSVLKNDVGLPGPLIPNTYDTATFRLFPEIPRDLDVAFLGRFVSVKGADILIDAVARLKNAGVEIKASLIGEGLEEKALKDRANALGVSQQINFTGGVRGEPLARLLNRHRIVAVPSRWEEPFGIVALEALACGCVTVVADSGALPEVVGPCGPTVPKNDPDALAAVLRQLLGDPASMQRYRDAMPAHLARFTEATHLDACEAVIHDTLHAWHGNGVLLPPATPSSAAR